MELGFSDVSTPEDLLGREWLETDGRGGFSSGTVGWAPVRRFHALLEVAGGSPTHRLVLLNQLAEVVEVGAQRFGLGIVPIRGTETARCIGFSSWPWPTWHYELGDVQLTRELLRPEGAEAVLVRYRLLKPLPAKMLIRPFLTGRAANQTFRSHWWHSYDTQQGRDWVCWKLHGKKPPLFCLAPASYHRSPEVRRRVCYSVDEERGEPSEEDWYSPGVLEIGLDTDGTCSLAFSTQQAVPDIAATFEAARSQRKAWVQSAPVQDPLFVELHQAARSFLVQTPEGPLLIPGYPWFPPVSRDTFTALPGLLLVTGHHDLARGILEFYGRQLSRGMIPHIPRIGDEKATYESIDSSLWFVRGVASYLRYTGDLSFVIQACWRTVRKILDAYREGTRYRIRMDHDGLITSSGYHRTLTWMDSAYGIHVYTPRQGKPVEVQALWIHALKTGAFLAEQAGDPAFARRCREDYRHALGSFRERFWYEEGGYLYDVIDGIHGDDPSLRPNQLYAFAVDDELVTSEHARRLLEVVESKLLTPMGLRSLDPNDRRYKPRYVGSRRKRDPAYHQGTVWPFFLGPYAQAVLRVRGRSHEQRQRLRALFQRFCDQTMVQSVGHMPEIFDGDPPHIRRGCFAQAWNCGELLLVLSQDLLELGNPAAEPLPETSENEPGFRTAHSGASLP